MSGAYAAGGVAGLILVAAAVGSLALLVAATSRRSRLADCRAPLACWSPALVLMSWRFDPRPEIFTLSLHRLLSRGAVAGAGAPSALMDPACPPGRCGSIRRAFSFSVQFSSPSISSNTPLGMCSSPGGAAAPASPSQSASWVQVGLPSLAVAGACLLNPYLLDGARFPFDLLPKVTAIGQHLQGIHR